MRRCPSCNVNLDNCNRHICILTHGKCRAYGCNRVAITRPFLECDLHIMCSAKGCDEFMVRNGSHWRFCDAHKCKWNEMWNETMRIGGAVCNSKGTPNFCKKHLTWVRLYKKLCVKCGRVQPWKITAYLCLKRTFGGDICRMIMQLLPQEGVCSETCAWKSGPQTCQEYIVFKPI